MNGTAFPQGQAVLPNGEFSQPWRYFFQNLYQATGGGAPAITAAAVLFIPGGSITVANVQAAIGQLDANKQAADATLSALAALSTSADKLIFATGVDAFALTALTAFARTLLDDADAATMQATLGLGSAAVLTADMDTTLAANSDSRVATQRAVKAYADALVTGLLDLQGDTDASSNPNYPAASKGDAYYVTVAGKIGGASGKSVDIGDLYVAKANNAGGTEAAVGASWFVLEHNLVGALLAANNLSDLASAATARTNLGLGSISTQAASAVNITGGTIGLTSGSLGYATGSGGTVTQATSKSTGVTLNAVTGQITMHNAALAANAVVTFTLTDSAIAATDIVLPQLQSGNATAGTYEVWCEASAAGSVKFNVRNISGGSLSEALVLSFAVLKSVNA